MLISDSPVLLEENSVSAACVRALLHGLPRFASRMRFATGTTGYIS